MAKDKTVLEDEITVRYQTEKWGEEKRLLVSSEGMDEAFVLVKVSLVDEKGIPCLDSKKVIRFELAGDGELVKNQGTVSGSSKVQAANGTASIRVKRGSGKSVVAVKSENLETQFVTIN